MTIRAVAAFVTTDDKIHLTKEEAVEHQKLIDLTDQVTNFAKLHFPHDIEPVVNIIIKWEQEKPLPPVTLQSLKLPDRTYRVFDAEKITSIEMLKNYSFDGLLKIPNMGRRSAIQIKDALATVAIFLKEKDED